MSKYWKIDTNICPSFISTITKNHCSFITAIGSIFSITKARDISISSQEYPQSVWVTRILRSLESLGIKLARLFTLLQSISVNIKLNTLKCSADNWEKDLTVSIFVILEVKQMILQSCYQDCLQETINSWAWEMDIMAWLETLWRPLI